ncbi:unnamed protein product [Onchocerca flexuosa]|uniref:Ig-like domain-containing protein n=1 Tax=Onchocerca flexuosa TaxID=387005 RepID=A0A183H2X5_9BILA|nr:unnamed protein product [Onchocerca flexuosa]
MVARDDGRYECFIDGKPHGSVTLHVISVAEGLGRGTANFIITMMLSIPFVTFAIFYRLLHPQRETIVLESPVVDFYSKLLDLTTEGMKVITVSCRLMRIFHVTNFTITRQIISKLFQSNIIKTVYEDKTKIKRKEMESTYSSQRTLNGGRMRNNRDTVMTIVNVAEINQRKNYSATNRK